MPVQESNSTMFGTEGPIMEGKWFNPNTGDTFVVRDSFFQDGQYTVTTTDGRVLNYNQLQNYIKANGPTNNEIIKPESSLPPEVLDLISDSGPASNSIEVGMEDIIHASSNQITSSKQQKLPDLENDLDHMLIKRFLKNKSVIDIDPNISWVSMPVKEIDILTNMLGIDINNIIDYIIKEIDIQSIREIIYDKIKQSIEDLNQNKIDTPSKRRKP